MKEVKDILQKVKKFFMAAEFELSAEFTGRKLDFFFFSDGFLLVLK
jgi:hypothetical protein